MEAGLTYAITPDTTRTMPGRVGVLADLRLLFGPEIDEDEIEHALELAICDLQAIVTTDRLLDEAGRLAQLRLDALAQRDVRTR
jgi:hypothetical protein